MMLSTPRWWYGRARAPAWRFALYPLSWIWAAATARRLARGQAVDPGAPVICIGNLTVGGAGKTPVAREIALRLQAAGKKPFILSRGHGGAALEPTRVDPLRHRFLPRDEDESCERFAGTARVTSGSTPCPTPRSRTRAM